MAKRREVPKFGPLQDVKVAFCGTSILAPVAGEMLAEWGADVIWFENSTGQDVGRVTMMGEQDRRNMRSMVLNIPTPKGREVFLKIIRDLDIFIEASKGNLMEKWGLGDDVLWAVNPALVITHLSGFGLTGLPEYVNRASYDPIAQAFSGYMWFNGYPDRPPTIAGPSIGDLMPCLTGLAASLAAMHRAKATGIGESIDLAQYEPLLRLQARYNIQYFTRGIAVPDDARVGDRNDKFAAWGNFQTKDGKSVYICMMGGGVFPKGLKELGLEYGTKEYPKGSVAAVPGTPQGDEMTRRLEKYCLERTAAEIEEHFTEIGIPVCQVMTHEMIAAHPHVAARKNLTEWKSEITGKTLKGVNLVPNFKNNPGRIWRGMPVKGVDTKDVLADAGYTPEEIAEIEASGIITPEVK